MSQLVKLKAAVQPLLLAPLAASQGGQRFQARHTNVAAANNNVARRWITSTNAPAAAAAAVASPSTAVTHSSRSSTGSSNSGLVFGLLGLTAGACFVASTAEEVLAEPASSLDAHAADAVAPPTSEKKKKKKKSAKQSKRKQLDYPGKFNKMHTAAESVVSVPVGAGVRIQAPMSAFSPDQFSDKSCAVIPIVEVGGPNGPSLQFVVQTGLGRKHSLEAYTDSMGNHTGHYKFMTDFGVSIKPTFQLTGNGNAMGIDIDHKGREHAFALNIGSQGEATASFNQSLTPNLIGGVELHYLAGAATHLNGGLKYSTSDNVDIYAFTKKDGKYTASYWRKLEEILHPHAHLGYPSQSTSVGLTTNFSTTSQKSEIIVGVKHARLTYNYQLALVHGATPCAQMAFDTTLIEGAQFRWGASSQFNFDGSSEMTLGLNLALPF